MRHVLLLDDDEDLRLTVRQILLKAGFSVSDFPDGTQALAFCQENLPALVITDMVMPHSPGYEVILSLRQHFPKLKILAISGGSRLSPREYLDLAKLVGADMAIPKPFQARSLVSAVRQLLGE
jgi:CheY-like chemotaxis protein